MFLILLKNHKGIQFRKNKFTTKKITHITNILEQIDTLNHQIDLHKKNDGDKASIEQYEYIKADFVQELNNLMLSFNLQIKPIVA